MTNPDNPWNNGEGNTPGGQPGQPHPYPGGDAASGNTGGYQPYPGGASGGAEPYGAPGYAGGYQQGYAGGTQNGPGPYGAGQPLAKNSVAAWALGVSILAFVMTVTLFLAVFAPVVGIVGLILGIVAVVKARRLKGPGRRMGMSIAAIIISVLSIILPVILLGFGFAILDNTGLTECTTLPPEEQQACIDGVLSDM